ncbi:MAG: peptidylprolyl isomerase [Paracoccaceae bacterium]
MRALIILLAAVAGGGALYLGASALLGFAPLGGGNIPSSPAPAAGQGTEAAPPAGANILTLEIAGEAKGIVAIRLLPDVAPRHVARIRELARTGAYDGVVFHRVIDGFMAQTGDVRFGRKQQLDAGRVGQGGSALPDLPAEFSDIPYERGIVGMARGPDQDSANSQFFIMFDDARFLDGQYTVVGRVIAGMEIVDAIKRGDKALNGAVDDPDYMVKVSVRSDE